jgi:hypothetical protein
VVSSSSTPVSRRHFGQGGSDGGVIMACDSPCGVRRRWERARRSSGSLIRRGPILDGTRNSDRCDVVLVDHRRDESRFGKRDISTACGASASTEHRICQRHQESILKGRASHCLEKLRSSVRVSSISPAEGARAPAADRFLRGPLPRPDRPTERRRRRATVEA